MNRGHFFLFVLLAFFIFLPQRAAADAEERSFGIINAADGLADNSAQTITRTKSGRMVISTIGHINFYDGASFSHISSESSDVYTLSNYKGHYHIYFDKYHHIWLKDSTLVTCVDLLTEYFTDNISPIFQSMNIYGTVDDLFVDGEGELWMLCGDTIYTAFKKRQIPVRRDAELQDLADLNNRVMLFFSDGIVEYYSEEGEKLFSYRIYKSQADIDTYYMSTVYFISDYEVFQIRNGLDCSVLVRHNVKEGTVEEVFRTPYNLNNMSKTGNLIYIACSYGYWTYDITTHALHHFDTIKMADGRLLNMSVNVLQFDSQGGMWLGTEERGILYSKPYQSPFKVYEWSNDRAIYIYQQIEAMLATRPHEDLGSANCRFTDSRGWTWVGGMSGLCYYLPDGGEPIYVDKKQGLLNDVIHSIIEDDNGVIWVGTSNGISAIQTTGEKVSFVNSYDHADNVPSESFLDDRAIKLPDGNIAMQAVDHVVEFNPNVFTTLNPQSFGLRPKFIRLMVNGRYVAAGDTIEGKIIIHRAVSRTDYIKLDHNQNTVTLVFSGLNYFRPKQTYYRVNISNLQPEWRTISYYNTDGLVDEKGLLHLPLMGLRPGRYTVAVQASMNPAVWEGKILEITVEIEAPWWQRSAVSVAMIVILMALMVINIVYYNSNYRKRLRCASGEHDLKRRLAGFIEHSESCRDDLQTPHKDEIYGTVEDTADNDLEPEFVEIMLEMMPLIREKTLHHDHLVQTAQKRGLTLVQLYDLLSRNVFKTPRLFTRAICLEEACEMLRTTQYDIARIAGLCRFDTPNFFIACFFHRYGVTPLEYRKQNT